jgi:hypothetical protein
MALYTPPDIAGGLQDFWNYIRVDRPHRWPALGLAITVPLLVFYFMARSVEPEPPKRQIIYVQSWPADRSEFTVRREWLNRALAANDHNERVRANYGEMAKVLGQDFDAAKAASEFDAARATIRKALADLDAAEAAGLPLPPLPRAAAQEAQTTPRAAAQEARTTPPAAAPEAGASPRTQPDAVTGPEPKIQ